MTRSTRSSLRFLAACLLAVAAAVVVATAQEMHSGSGFAAASSCRGAFMEVVQAATSQHQGESE